jgi:GNAT superfamily N-acetyltransferase
VADTVLIRRATLADIATIAHHRVEMFREMGRVFDGVAEPLRATTIAHLEDSMARDEYVAWMASLPERPDDVIGGAGVHRRSVQPFPTTTGPGAPVAIGREGIVMNVYTEPEARRRGVARALMQMVLAWARHEPLDSLVLRASDDGRPLYESLGFVRTNEMRFLWDTAE